jgi:hypothetical protein
MRQHITNISRKFFTGYRRLGIVVILAIVSAAPFMGSASALSACQREVFDNHILYYNCDLGKDCTQPGAVLVNGEAIKQAFAFFVQEGGLTGEQSAGIVGNLIAESGMRPNALSPDGGAHGIVQWRDGRWDGNPPVNGKPASLVAYANSTTHNTEDFLTQLNFALIELQNGYASVLEELKTATTPEDAAYIIKEKYEIPDNDHARNGKENAARAKNAKDVFNRYGGSVAAGSSSGSSSCSGNAVTDCKGDGSATERAAILCEARKFDPCGYEFGGGHVDPEVFMQAPDTIACLENGEFKNILDCSGIITVALWNAFHVKIPLTAPATQAGLNALNIENFEPIAINETQPGDIVFKPGGVGHVEIVSSNGADSTFGAHDKHGPAKQDTDISEDALTAAQRGWTKAYRYNGPGVTQ